MFFRFDLRLQSIFTVQYWSNMVKLGLRHLKILHLIFLRTVREQKTKEKKKGRKQYLLLLLLRTIFCILLAELSNEQWACTWQQVRKKDAANFMRKLHCKFAIEVAVSRAFFGNLFCLKDLTWTLYKQKKKVSRIFRFHEDIRILRSNFFDKLALYVKANKTVGLYRNSSRILKKTFLDFRKFIKKQHVGPSFS